MVSSLSSDSFGPFLFAHRPYCSWVWKYGARLTIVLSILRPVTWALIVPGACCWNFGVGAMSLGNRPMPPVLKGYCQHLVIKMMGDEIESLVRNSQTTWIIM